ncbi:MAG TPA: hypothetical protein VNW15_14330 [Rhizomicrobium sp.]|nr:hypothetical protein [Rhizomicrobium sp.]
MDSKQTTPGRLERLVRALLLLSASLAFSFAAWAAGASRLQNPVWVYGVIGGVIIAALLVSRLGAKLVVRRLAERGQANNPPRK